MDARWAPAGLAPGTARVNSNPTSVRVMPPRGTVAFGGEGLCRGLAGVASEKRGQTCGSDPIFLVPAPGVEPGTY